ncbi:MAG: restriction endonuclease subunit S [Lachnospiraceae bacterium]|nr:restriction endonuclease subunit S [Lachnospiraceae bacterium]
MTENTVLDNNVSSIIKFKDKDGNEYPEWEYAPIGTVCEINPKPDKLENEFYYIDLESVEDGKLLDEKIVFKSNAPSRAQRTLKENDILFQMVRPYQKNNYFFREVRDKQSVASTGYAQIRSNNINPMFVYEFIFANKFVNDVLLRCTGSNYPAINSNDLKGINISIPCKEEQSKIALFLSSIDNLISIQESSISILETYNKGLISQIFKQEIRFKDDNGNEFPDWIECKLKDLYIFEYGEGNNNPSNGGQYPVYGANGIIGSYTKYNAEQSIIIGHMGAYAGSVLWEDRKHFVTYNGTITKPKDKAAIVPKYGYYLLLNRKIDKICAGSGMPFLAYSTLNNIKVITTLCLKEQEKIANFLTSLDNVLQEEKNYLKYLKTIKKGLLQQMFV